MLLTVVVNELRLVLMVLTVVVNVPRLVLMVTTVPERVPRLELTAATADVSELKPAVTVDDRVESVDETPDRAVPVAKSPAVKLVWVSTVAPPDDATRITTHSPVWLDVVGTVHQ